ncbi:MAG: hypothetical protein ACTHMC_13955 [Pseudobacter sp.]|uniref:hypothetical protein n=1 Tax=Pseudobacter sp. TaxID=2045420 RepID=UPI003F7EB653
MLKAINDLHASTADEEIKGRAHTAGLALYHTLHKELNYVKSRLEAMRKKNAAKKCTTEYNNAQVEAIRQIHMDIGFLN